MTEPIKTGANERARKIAVATALATALAAPAEGLRQIAYYDPPGILTACRGHTGPDVKAGVVYSLAQCDAWLTADMRKAITQVERCAPGLPPPVLAAFADAAFNMGPTIACDTRSSTAARHLHEGRLVDACNQLPRWNKARVAGVLVPLPGLTTRRAAERDLCMQGTT
jgi:GH24 family phage-related lysozyme (muramidase)